MYQEILHHIGPAGSSSITPTSLSNLHYLKACIKEAQRLKPIVPISQRALPIDVVIKGYHIPKGTVVVINHEYTSNSPKYFKDPSSFYPERWLRQDQSGRRIEGRATQPFVVLPFGFGPRMCIGRRFADQELYIGMIKIIQSFKVKYDGDALPLKGIGLDKMPIELDFQFEER